MKLKLSLPVIQTKMAFMFHSFLFVEILIRYSSGSQSVVQGPQMVPETPSGDP